MQAFIGQKQDQSQAFLEDGARIPITRISAPTLPVVAIKTKEKDGYFAMQLGLGIRKREAKGEKAPRFFREVRVAETEVKQPGEMINATDVFKIGDIVDVSGVSKGKGFAGVVKRHHFKGGPRTHGQSDRERAPGSIGQTTTPGRVYKGKRMAGRMGGKSATVRNLEVVEVTENSVLVKGLIPGNKDSVVVIKKVGEKKKFVPLYKEEVKEDASK
ncbi:MAG: 50S ribosomal protein L3 [Candidatus Levybacteria bacterium]|nr:50S ribosomal protein L3 [Candidatus Levybacteria bacterium]